tara:strand:+ start:280 stop:879 length:600 start_codon:yes stop_codon:yes gene_type:complete
MKLTTKKLESLIQEMMGRRFDQDQEHKILGIIKKCRNLMLDLQVVQGFFPTIINGVYFYDKEEDIQKAIHNTVRIPHVKQDIMKHYAAIQKIANILEELNQYLVLLESLELEPGSLARTTKGLLFMGLFGPDTTGTSHSIKLDELREMMDTGIMFLEDINNYSPGFFGDGNMGFDLMREIVNSFHVNYFGLEDYLESVI